MSKKSSIVTVFIIIAIVIVTSITVILYKSNFFDSINAITTFSIQIVSLGLSITALVIAVVTYSSIDSVNMISTMEGNVLENENYTIAYSELVLNYASCKDIRSLQDKLFEDNINNIKYKSKTCIQFSDNLQNIIDSILWFAYTDVRSSECQSKAKELTELLDKKFLEFDRITNGNQYLLMESIKLIKYVLYYQGNRDTSDFNPKFDLINIRGKLLRNPISKIIYLDYLGLSYNAKAIALVKDICRLNGQVFLPENIKKIYNTDFKDKYEHINLYLQRAHKAFAMARELSEDEVLWEGYIKYNLARVLLMEALVNKSSFEEWELLIAETIEARHRVAVLFGDLIKDGENSYLINSFEKELYLSKMVKYSYEVAMIKDNKRNGLRSKIIKDIRDNKESYTKFDLIKGYVEAVEVSIINDV